MAASRRGPLASGGRQRSIERPRSSARRPGAGTLTPTQSLRLKLVSSGDGWSLVAPSGDCVFHAPGLDGRQRCLEFARTTGVLSVFS
jgi:hypothetical protein